MIEIIFKSLISKFVLKETTEKLAFTIEAKDLDDSLDFPFIKDENSIQFIKNSKVFDRNIFHLIQHDLIAFKLDFVYS